MVTSEGLYCCDELQQWKDLKFEVRESRWLWKCSICGKTIGIIPFALPEDTPSREGDAG